MRLLTATPIVGASALMACLPAGLSLTMDSSKPPKIPKRGCDTAAAVTVVAGSGLQPEDGVKVIDNNLRTKWVAKGRGESLWLELAAPTIIDSVAIAFRKGKKRVHTFAIYLVTEDNQAELVFEGESSGTTKHFQTFSLGDKAQEASAVTIVGYGNSKNKWNGYAEVQLCTHETPEEAPELEVVIETPETEVGSETESGIMPSQSGTGLPFPEGRKGFNIVNQCSFPIRVGSTGNEAPCNEGTRENPANGNCFWALPEGQRDLRPGEYGHYVLPRLGLMEGQITWAGNIWASTGCASSASEDYEFPSTSNCVTNFCSVDGVCPDYHGPSGVTTKAEFGLVEGGFDFYDVSIIDGSNIPMEIEPIDPVFNPDDHFCAIPGSTDAIGELDACHWKFNPEKIDGHEGTNLAPYTRVVWPAHPDHPVSCLGDEDCAGEIEGFGFCGIYEERENNGDTKTGSAVPGVCGRPVGWMGAHTACVLDEGKSLKEGESFPGGFPFNCDLAASDGTVKQLIRCTGQVYSKQACYLPDAEESCCGCPPWDIENGGCISSNLEWLQSALPWANFFKSACPTAYSFPRDDRTSMFVCSDAETQTRLNTQSYLIRFCPGDSEQSFYS